MDDQPEPHSLASTFPNPPEFWKDFTQDNIAELVELKLARGPLDQDDASNGRIPDLPEHLRHLQPPPEPADGRWRVFGDQYVLDDKLPTLEEQGIQNLPATASSGAKDAKHYDRAFELKRLVKSLLLNFLELNGILARNPADAEAKVLDIRTLFINIHHILNEYRPHQARESAIEMMQDHLDRTRTETAAIRTQVDKARKVLEGLGSLDLSLFQQQQKQQLDATPFETDLTVEDVIEGERRERAAAAWCMADALLN
ncbi:MED7 domain-containing protein [Trichoderma longibrachiatum]|uniref:Mediator of RNA polymerase II transcription subunit 7 n=1 Tax=Trichoderma longibrachiatum ATCC 18648 TaxID=983965 RepID=A0A2T4BRC3_TRILO|nr:MED7-domain-containing protein [Trichoderma longibrachiatum ATCC 18648]